MSPPRRRLPKRIQHFGAVFLLGAASVSAQAPTDLRVALVIGNSAYARTPLQNPANDAEAMAKSLRTLGFDVIELHDGSKAQMAEAIAKVSDVLKGKKGVGMLYYAGHGLQLDWHNYMVPVDAAIAKAADVPQQTVDVGSVIEAFKTAGNRMNILVLDACRNNPFASTASGKGLAQLDAPPGTLLAYSTAPGNVADDGDGTNGLYTQYLLAELGKPTAKIEDVFKRVRLQVRQKSAGRQIPWESTSLEDDFYFDDARSKTAKAERDRLAASERARTELFAQERAAWDRVKDSTTADDVYAFLQQFPSGSISQVAQGKLEYLAQSKVIASPVKDRENLAPVGQRFKLGDAREYEYRDVLTKVVMKRQIQRVSRIDGELVELDVGVVLTQSGGVVRIESGTRFDPPLMAQPTDLQIGQKWAGRTQQYINPSNPNEWLEYSCKVPAYEQVVVPAGTFMAYRVECSMSFQSGARLEQVDWISPTAYSVKTNQQVRYRGPGIGGFSRELLKFTPGPA